VEVTSHNHGFAVAWPRHADDGSGAVDSAGEAGILDTEFGRVEVSHVCLNDNVVEGLRALDVPAFTVQYHPEAAAGPHDADYLFDRFVELTDNA
jgi:carbamoyl-phosphate synthase small subunit